MPKSMNELKAEAYKYIEWAKEELIKTDGVLAPAIALLDGPDGLVEFIAVDGRITNSYPAKEALAKKVGEEIKEKGFKAVIMVTDSFLLQVKQDKVNEVMKLREQGLRNKQLAELGMGEIVEQITATIEMSNGKSWAVNQPYTHEGDKIVFGKPTDYETPMVTGIFTWFSGEGTIQ